MTTIRWKVGAPSTYSRLAPAQDTAWQLIELLHGDSVELQELSTGTGAYAFIVTLAQLLGWAHDSKQAEIDWPESELPEEHRLIFVDSSVGRETLETLLKDLLSQRLSAPVPTWAASSADARSLEVYRRVGAVGTLIVHGKDKAAPLSFQLFPITLDALSPLRRRLTPETRLPEEPDDNLKRRADWFHQQFGNKK